MVSNSEQRSDETRGGINQDLFLKKSKTLISNNCAARKAIPEPITILETINSWRLKIKDNISPVKNPANTTLRANFFPKKRFASSVIKKETGYVKAPQVIISLSWK